jgi:hypothetical protein
LTNLYGYTVVVESGTLCRPPNNSFQHHSGPLVSWNVGALEGAVVVGGLGALAAAFASIGIPKASTVQCETAIKSDKFIVIAHGLADEVAKTKSILKAAGSTQTDVRHGISA